MNVEASDVFAKASDLSFPEAANLLLVATTAPEMLHVTGVSSGDVGLPLDAVGSDEAVHVSPALVPDRRRVVAITAVERAKANGFQSIGASNPASGPYRVLGQGDDDMQAPADPLGYEALVNVRLGGEQLHAELLQCLARRFSVDGAETATGV